MNYTKELKLFTKHEDGEMYVVFTESKKQSHVSFYQRRTISNKHSDSNAGYSYLGQLEII